MDEQTRQRRRLGGGGGAPAACSVDYRRLASPLPLVMGGSDDRIRNILRIQPMDAMTSRVVAKCTSHRFFDVGLPYVLPGRATTR